MSRITNWGAFTALIALTGCGDAAGGASAGGSPVDAAALSAVAPSGDTATGDSALGPTADVDPAFTWSGGIAAVFADHCTGCHTAGGIGPFALDDYGSAQLFSTAVLAAVESGAMPPWMPDQDCRTYEGQRSIAPDEIAAIRGWVEAGAPEGAPLVPSAGRASARVDPLTLLGEPTLRIAPKEAYTPNPERPDDYRCFVLDHTFAEETYLTASQVHPDQQALVHHVLLYLVPAEMTAVAAALDDEEEGPGYTCFGGPGVSADTIGAWVPGSVPIITPPDTAIRLPAGSRIVLQIHYNVLAKGSLPDATSLDLWLQDEQPKQLLSIDPLPNLGIDIQAGDPESVQTRTFTNQGVTPWTIVGTAPHMHLLGKRIAVTAVHADGSEECLVDIPKWNFNWQQTYRFLPGEEVLVQPGESIRLECVYDNSAANQPIVNGVKQTPVHVGWGDGTLDEMCLDYIMTVEPFAPLPPPPTDLCGGFDACYASCREGEGAAAGLTACSLLCGSASSSSCTKCVVQGLLGCTSEDCGAQKSDLVGCLTGCQGSPNFKECMAQQCAGAMAAFDLCAEPVVAAGTCDAPIGACGASMTP